MPPARSIRQRAVYNENDENTGTTRVTRAKTAALTVADSTSGGKKIVKKSSTMNKSTMTATTSNAAPIQRKRPALGDVSNVAKHEPIGTKDEKKPMNGKTGLVSKTTLNGGVQKKTSRTTSRSVLGAKDHNKKTTTTTLKRPASGAGLVGGPVKKQRSSSSQASKDESPSSESELSKDTQVADGGNPAEAKQKDVYDDPHEQVESITQAFADGVVDLDAEDAEDPLMVAEYVVEIFDYLRVLEVSTMPNPKYMEHQDNLEWHLRGVLVDWLIEVHTRFHLLPETLFLAVNIIDRFLSTRIVELDRLQLVGVTAMFIASKYEEVLSPHVQNFKHVADDGFSEEEILKAERFVLSALNYDLSYPNPMNFLRRISKADNYDIQTRTLGKYLMEITVVDHKFLVFHPSHIAAASMYTARLMLLRGEWDATLSHYSGYTEEEMQPIFKMMVDYLRRPVAHEAFFKKYASKKFLKASILARQWAKKNYELYLEAVSPQKKTNDAKGRGVSKAVKR